MANIKNLQVWNSICTDARIGVKSSLFGLRSAAVYNPTDSIIDVRVLEFSSDDGEQLKRILSASGVDRAKAIGAFRPKPISNGNYLAEVCTSRDGAFLAIQLFQFSVLNYEPVTEVHIYEGDDARLVGKLL